ncbi:response regulator transcription factor [Paenibacillus solisilvae]|uniref:Response regulator transcription factor n=1 Tax=Paenibacillus solisilvae TaxID=2486751 RepID=A0ABW0W3B0_9BACL
MAETNIRLTIDSSSTDDLDRAKLAELHQIVVDQVMRLEINEYVKVTLEYEGSLRSPGAVTKPDEKDSGKAGIRNALSERQRQIAELLCNHYSITRIAADLFVSVNTVKKHIQNMKKALEIDASGADFIYVLKQMMEGGAFMGDKHNPIG